MPELFDDPQRLDALIRAMKQPRMMGAAIDLLAGYAVNATGFAGAVSPQALFTNNLNPLSNPIYASGAAMPVPNPWGILICFVPNVTAVNASASATCTLLDQAANSLGTGVEWAQTAAASNVGNIICAAPLAGTGGPGAAPTRSFGATLTTSAGTITAPASAGSPIVAVAFSFVS